VSSESGRTPVSAAQVCLAACRMIRGGVLFFRMSSRSIVPHRRCTSALIAPRFVGSGSFSSVGTVIHDCPRRAAIRTRQWRPSSSRCSTCPAPPDAGASSRTRTPAPATVCPGATRTRPNTTWNWGESPRWPAVTTHRQGFLTLFDGQMHFGGPPTARATQPMIGRFVLTHPAGRLFLLTTIGPRARRVLMRPIDGGVHTHIPGDQPGGVSAGLQRGHDQYPHPGPLPAPEQPVHGFTSSRIPVECRARASPPGPATGSRRSTAVWSTSVGDPASSRRAATGSSIAHCASVRSARPVAATLATRSPVFSISLVVDRSTGDLLYLINDTPIRSAWPAFPWSTI
jgi:hypothetical protein